MQNKVSLGCSIAVLLFSFIFLTICSTGSCSGNDEVPLPAAADSNVPAAADSNVPAAADSNVPAAADSNVPAAADSKPINGAYTSDIPGLNILESHPQSTAGAFGIVGKIRNDTSHDYSIVTLGLIYEHDDSIEKETSLAWSVKAHSTASFKANCLFGAFTYYEIKISGATNIPVTPDMRESPEYESRHAQAIKKWPVVMAEIQRRLDGHHASSGNVLLIWRHSNSNYPDLELRVPVPVDRSGHRINYYSEKGLRSLRLCALLFAENLYAIRKKIGFSQPDARRFFLALRVVGSDWIVASVREDDLPKAAYPELGIKAETSKETLERRVRFITRYSE